MCFLIEFQIRRGVVIAQILTQKLRVEAVLGHVSAWKLETRLFVNVFRAQSAEGIVIEWIVTFIRF